MVARPWLAVFILGALGSMGAQHRTKNFVVEAPTPQMAERFGQWAEYYRKEKAVQWLGKEMPPWGRPCPLNVKVSNRGSGGATTFEFDNGAIRSITMEIEGTVDRLIASVLPHEVTHTVFAYHFRRPVPRWADEGGSVLSEDDQEKRRHEHMVRQFIASGRMIPLKRLFALTQYPRDVMVLYAEGYSVTSFLVGKSSRAAFLTFVRDGMNRGWDAACQQHYGYSRVEELEAAWLASLRKPRDADAVASAGAAERQPAAAEARPAGGVVMRQTLPSLGAPRPVYRGVSGGDEPSPLAPQAPTNRSASPPPGMSEPGRTRPDARLGTPRPVGTAEGGWRD